MEHVALFAAGLGLLALGAPLLVFGAARLDRAIGRSPFAVGAVAVCLGPCVAGLTFDLAVILRQQPVTRLVVGHLIGGCAASIGLVLGVAALVRPLAATANVFRTAIPLALVGALVFWLFAFDERYPRFAAGALLGAFAAAAAVLGVLANREPESVKAEMAGWVPERLAPRWAVPLAVAGLLALAGGGRLVAAECVGAASHLKVPSLVLGSTAGAFVTSLPALGAAAVAARRGRSDLALGAVVGSVLVNVLLVTGVVAMIEPLKIDPWVIREAVPTVPLFALLLLPAAVNGLRVPRWQGAVLLTAYAAFVAWQVRVALAVRGG